MTTRTKPLECDSEGVSVESVHISAHTSGQLKKAFLEAFRYAGVIYPTCKNLGIGRTTIYDWLAADEDFKREFEQAREDFADLLEEELYHRVRDNTIKGKNDLALFCALKGNRREKFGDNLTVTPKEQVLTIRVERIDPPYVKLETLEAPKQLQEPVIDITCEEDN